MKFLLVVGLNLIFVAACTPANVAPIIYYSPVVDLEYIDVALIDRAKHAIDLAAYVLTDRPIVQALTRAVDRGVKVRLYLDGGQLRARTSMVQDLVITPDVEIRIKPAGKPLMHIKAYQIDGHFLRTGSANFSASGEKRQDNDLIIIESAEAAHNFTNNFEVIWENGEVLK